MPTLAWILLACLAGGLVSVLLASLVAFRIQARLVPVLVSYAVGALLGAVFLEILPHLFEQTVDYGGTAALVLAGMLGFFLLEKLLLWRHHHFDADGGHDHGHDHGHGHSHAHGVGSGRAGVMVTVGDAFHNFTDGIMIAGAFVADTHLGIVTAAAIIAHEVPQEVGDFLILLDSGYSKARALALNALSSLASVAGALLGYFALSAATEWVPRILAIAAAGMLYVAVADLIPGLHRRTRLMETAQQFTFIALGIATVWLVHLALGHSH